MANEEFYTNEEGNLFVQTSRASPMGWLTCTGVGDIAIPRGDRTPQYCPKPGASGAWEIVGFIKGDAGAGTYSLTKPLANVYNFLIEQKCSFAARINWVCAGLREDPRNYEVALVMPDNEASSSGITNPVRTPDGTAARVLTNMDLSFMNGLMLYPLVTRRQTVTNTANGNSVFFLPELCESRCKNQRALCEVGVIGLDRSAGYLYDAEVKVTEDGFTWAAAATDPFTYGGNVGPVLAFDIRDGQRLIVFRSEPVVGAPAEAAYSDDLGATWTNVTLPGINGLAVYGATIWGARIIAVGEGGYIWESTDLAESFSTLDAGAASGGVDLLDVACYGANLVVCVGNTNMIVVSEDGGVTFGTVTGPAVGVNLLTVDTTDVGDIFIGGNDGIIYRTVDINTTAVAWEDFTGGTVPWLRFDPDAEYIGFAIHNAPSGMGYIYKTEDGGATWYVQPNMPTNSGLNGGHICDQNHMLVVGDAHGGTTFIAKSQPTVA
jgi:hypothetical protein